MIYIKDLFNRGRFLSQQQLSTKYNIQCETLLYNGIKTAIPRPWVAKLSSSNIKYDMLEDV
jgi:hypothetical protein